jgi:hypothetical protein
VSGAVNDLLGKDEDDLHLLKPLFFGINIVYNFGHSGNSFRSKKICQTSSRNEGSEGLLEGPWISLNMFEQQMQCQQVSIPEIK